MTSHGCFMLICKTRVKYDTMSDFLPLGSMEPRNPFRVNPCWHSLKRHY